MKYKSTTNTIQQEKMQGDKGFSITGPNYWNKLPNYIKEAENLRKLKRNLKTHLFRLSYNKQSVTCAY